MPNAETRNLLLSLAAKIVAAHVGHNDTAAEALPSIIKAVHETLAEIAAETTPPGSVQDHFHAHTHASHDGGTDDMLVCLEDGLKMKMLKRHLMTVHGLTPEEYRTKWGLPDDYPMVAANYAKLRSSLAKESGLGLRPAARQKRRAG